MKTAVVIDTSRELNQELYTLYNVYPIGYIVEDSKGKTHNERSQIQKINTSELISLVKRDNNARIFAPNIKEFVELYTYLAEEYDSLISIHSSLVTPAVFDNALVAKKLVSEIKIDIIDTHTLGAASGLFVEELVKFILEAKNINTIRKESINLNKHINSFILSKNDQLTTIGLRSSSMFSFLTSSFRPYTLYQYFHNNWKELRKSRSVRTLFDEIRNSAEIVKKTKDIHNIYYSSSWEFNRELKSVLKILSDSKSDESPHSLVTYFLLGKNYFDFAFI
ncbi:MAG: DegV family protein [Candidatus Heimdallarchaeota archaeon]|nr:DegV family protein [Candidatus Heimdallarchaeota archaeon]MCK4955032.1 DegV family protein [Candidatus Heimdallarchaeota archaeon]